MSTVHFSLPRSEAREFVWSDELGTVFRWQLHPYSRARGDRVQKLFRKLLGAQQKIGELAPRADEWAKGIQLPVDEADIERLGEGALREKYLSGLDDAAAGAGRILLELKRVVDRAAREKAAIFVTIVVGVVTGDGPPEPFLRAKHAFNLSDEHEGALLAALVGFWKQGITQGGYRQTAESLLAYLGKEAATLFSYLPADARARLVAQFADGDSRRTIVDEFFRPLVDDSAGNREERREDQKKTAS